MTKKLKYCSTVECGVLLTAENSYDGSAKCKECDIKKAKYYADIKKEVKRSELNIKKLLDKMQFERKEAMFKRRPMLTDAEKVRLIKQGKDSPCPWCDDKNGVIEGFQWQVKALGAVLMHFIPETEVHKIENWALTGRYKDVGEVGI